MRNALFLMGLCLFKFLAAQPQNVDRFTYCESCLMTAQEFEKAIKHSSPESRKSVIEELINGDVCRLPIFLMRGHLSLDKITASCKYLINIHYDAFYTALLAEEPKHLEITLCYEQSTACVGVKRKSFQNPERAFKDGDIETLIKENEATMRIAKPIHRNSPVTSKDEL